MAVDNTKTMDKQTIKHLLSDNHQTFTDYIGSLTEEDFLLSKNNKWTPGQQLEHIYLGVRPVRQILGFPKLLFKLVWGKANRQSKTYDELDKYILPYPLLGKLTSEK